MLHIFSVLFSQDTLKHIQSCFEKNLSWTDAIQHIGQGLLNGHIWGQRTALLPSLLEDGKLACLPIKMVQDVSKRKMEFVNVLCTTIFPYQNFVRNNVYKIMKKIIKRQHCYLSTYNDWMHRDGVYLWTPKSLRSVCFLIEAHNAIAYHKGIFQNFKRDICKASRANYQKIHEAEL